MRRYISKLLTITAIICIALLSTNHAFSEYKGQLLPDGTLVNMSEDDLDAFYQQKAIEETGGGQIVGSPSADSVSGNQESAPTSSETTKPAAEPTKPCTHHYTVEIIKEPTCAEEGEVKYTCDKCGDSYTDVAPATGEHSYIEEVTKEATCTEDGERVFTCSVCGDSYSEKIDALGHNYIESVTTEPTCTEVGVKTFTCDRCGDSYTEEIPAKGHVSDDGVVVKEASLFFDGLKEYHCTECGELLKSEVLPSQYPTYYLYIIIGVCCAIVAGIVIAVIIKRRR